MIAPYTRSSPSSTEISAGLPGPLGLLNAVSGGRLYHGRRMSKPGEWLFDLRDYFLRRP
jgi:hypothetical protein